MKNKKGFTLVEVLVVVVILGLILLIAIPSVSKYINQSKRKTLISSINGYITTVSNDVKKRNIIFQTIM